MAGNEWPPEDPPSRISRRAAGRQALLAVAALFAAVILLVASSLFMVGGGGHTVAYAAPQVPTATPPTVTPTETTPTASPSPTATPVPGTISILSPSTRQGPVGAHVTVSGSSFAGGSVALYGTSNSDCSGAQTSLGSAQVSGGTFTSSFLWPTSLNGQGTTYYICAAGVGAAPGYTVLAASQPSVQVSPTTLEVGKQVTISGSNFVGLTSGSTATIAVTDAGGNTTTLSPPALVTDAGTFNFQWTVPNTVGSLKIQAQSSPENGASPALQASLTSTIVAAAATVSPTASTGTGKTGDTSGNGGVIVAVIIGIVLILLVILGVVAFLLLRGRGGPPNGSGYGDGGYPTGAYPGYAERNRMPANVPQGMTGRQPVPGQIGGSGFYDPEGTYAGPPVGGVAQWDEPAEAPTAAWQPRPMSGYGPQYGQPGYDEGPTNPGAGGPQAGYGPADPWASQAGNYGALPPLDPSDEWGDGATQAADPGVPARPQPRQRQSGGFAGGEQFGGRGAGDTNPTNREGW